MAYNPAAMGVDMFPSVSGNGSPVTVGIVVGAVPQPTIATATRIILNNFFIDMIT